MKWRNLLFQAMGLILMGQLMVGCSSALPKDYTSLTRYQKLPPTDAPAYRIQTGDVLDVKFPYTDNKNEEVTVHSDGHIALNAVGDVPAMNKTTEELAQEIKSRASSRLRDPEVYVSIKQTSQKIYVGGEVGTAGFVPYRSGMTALQAVFERGGFKDTGQWDKIVVIRVQENEARVLDMNIDQIASLPLTANDAVFVPKTGIAKTGLAVKQFIRDVLPINAGYSISTY